MTCKTSIVGAVYGFKLAAQLADGGKGHCAAWPGLAATVKSCKSSTRLDILVDSPPWGGHGRQRVYIRAGEGLTTAINRHVTVHLRELRSPLRAAKVKLYNLVETREIDTDALPRRQDNYELMTAEDVEFWMGFVEKLPNALAQRRP